MANYDLNKMRIARCQNCHLWGVLQIKAMIRPQDLNTMTGEHTDAVPELWVCVTCFETPAGIESENIGHVKLPKDPSC